MRLLGGLKLELFRTFSHYSKNLSKRKKILTVLLSKVRMCVSLKHSYEASSEDGFPTEPIFNLKPYASLFKQLTSQQCFVSPMKLTKRKFNNTMYLQLQFVAANSSSFFISTNSDVCSNAIYFLLEKTTRSQSQDQCTIFLENAANKDDKNVNKNFD